MTNKKIAFSNEENFKSFMTQYEAIEDLDEIPEKIPDGIKIGDYAIRDVVVIELKTLKDDPKEKMENYFHDIMKRPDFPAIYGELNFRRVVSLLPDGNRIIRKFEQKAFRQIESIMRKANKQVISTIEHLKMNPNTAGTLIIINELAEFFEPDVLVKYLADMLGSKSMNSTSELRFPHLHNVILMQDTHKITNTNNSGTFIPVYHVVNDNLEDTETTQIAEKALSDIIEKYSHYSNCNHAVHNNGQFDVEKIEQPQAKEPLRGQEWIEDQYRKNRYMKDFTDEQLIEFGSMVMSVCYAIFLKEKPLIVDHHRKMQLFRNQIELLEESRLRPFDLKRLDIDPRRYAPKASHLN
ncbi:hypothetical protein ITG08_20355 [Vibrio cyclitrophicus]|uniref:hypothetical protein n=1 Tax=Vibrio cyclitrophicus TaxID=47951 RepID=UPI00206CB80A|nr:hypothetical protein [Vibrio cyclitrophicus]UPR26965.1 hypothetical protein ITG08_20355 [Vibrio cyclitrophicus]